jgi:hypothetical protein
MASKARVLGISGGVIGAIVGLLFFWGFLVEAQEYYSGNYFPANWGPDLLLWFVAVLGILAFSILGALGAAQKLDARPTVNAGALFLAGVVVLLCMLYFGSEAAMGGPDIFIFSLIFVFIGLMISVLFFLSGYLLLRKPAS